MERINLRKIIKRAREIIGNPEHTLPVRMASLELEVAARKLLMLIPNEEL